MEFSGVLFSNRRLHQLDTSCGHWFIKEKLSEMYVVAHDASWLPKSKSNKAWKHKVCVASQPNWWHMLSVYQEKLHPSSRQICCCYFIRTDHIDFKFHGLLTTELWPSRQTKKCFSCPLWSLWHSPSKSTCKSIVHTQTRVSMVTSWESVCLWFHYCHSAVDTTVSCHDSITKMDAQSPEN